MELHALKLLPITSAKTSRYATNLVLRHGIEPKCSSGWLCVASTWTLTIDTDLDLQIARFHSQHAAITQTQLT